MQKQILFVTRLPDVPSLFTSTVCTMPAVLHQGLTLNNETVSSPPDGGAVFNNKVGLRDANKHGTRSVILGGQEARIISLEPQ